MDLRDAAPGLQQLPPTLGKDRSSGPWRNVPDILARLALGARSLGPLRRLDVPALLPIKGGGLELVAPFPAEWSLPSINAVQRLIAVSSVVHTVGFMPHAKSKGISILPSIERVDPPPRAAGAAAAPPPPSGPSALTVSKATQYQIGLQTGVLRRRKWATFHLVASGLHCDGETAGAALPPLVGGLRDIEFNLISGIFSRVWRLSWSNSQKEIFWRLVYNGIKTPVRLHVLHRRCPCGSLPNAPPGRPHVFWDCPVAKAIRDVITAALPRPPHGSAHLSREHIWLFRPPQPGINQLLWDVICLAALGAMDRGRRTLLRLALQRVPGHAGGPFSDTSSIASDDSDFSSPVHTNVDIVSLAQRAAVACFFTGLADFCSISSTLPSSVKFTSSAASENHPLLRIRPRPVVEAVVAGPDGTPLPGPSGGSVFSVVLPPTVLLPRRDNLREMSLSRVSAGPSAVEILRARLHDQNSGDIIAGPAVFRGGVIENMVFCVCGSWRSALRAADADPEHVACGAG